MGVATVGGTAGGDATATGGAASGCVGTEGAVGAWGVSGCGASGAFCACFGGIGHAGGSVTGDGDTCGAGVGSGFPVNVLRSFYNKVGLQSVSLEVAY